MVELSIYISRLLYIFMLLWRRTGKVAKVAGVWSAGHKVLLNEQTINQEHAEYGKLVESCFQIKVD